MIDSFKIGAGALALVAAFAGSAAADMVGLTADNKLVHIDAAKWTAKKPVAITGVEGKVVGIDVRPANGMLYAVTDAGHIYTLKHETGAATKVATLSQAFTPGAKAVADFNPVADRLRLMGSSGQNFRVNVDDGQVAVDKPLVFDAADSNAAKKPVVVAGAYVNSVIGSKPTETALYNIEMSAGVLTLQAPPNDGVQKTKGAIGMAVPTNVAFDIRADGSGRNTAYLLAGKTLHTVDIATGKASRVGDIAGLGTVELIDIALIAPASMPRAAMRN